MPHPLPPPLQTHRLCDLRAGMCQGADCRRTDLLRWVGTYAGGRSLLTQVSQGRRFLQNSHRRASDPHTRENLTRANSPPGGPWLSATDRPQMSCWGRPAESEGQISPDFSREHAPHSGSLGIRYKWLHDKFQVQVLKQLLPVWDPRTYWEDILKLSLLELCPLDNTNTLHLWKPQLRKSRKLQFLCWFWPSCRRPSLSA